MRAAGFNVNAEWRPKGAKLYPYAFRISRKVKTLIEKGVPASNITIAGVDKAGKISLLVASYVGDPMVNYLIIGGCVSDETEAERFKENFELIPAGRILSIFDEDYMGKGSCASYLTQAEEGTVYKELVISTRQGQSLFYRPDKRWIEPVR